MEVETVLQLQLLAGKLWKLGLGDQAQCLCA